MKKMVKALVASTAMFAMGASVFAQVEIDAYNKIESNIVNITIPADSSAKTDFAGITDTAHVELKSAKVDALIEAKTDFGIKESTRLVNLVPEQYNYGLLSIAVSDYYVEFRPIELLTIGFHNGVHVAGDYLPIWDDRVSAGNFGSSLLSLVVRPVTGLRIGAALEDMAAFGLDNVKPGLNFGADYQYGDLGSLGFAVRNVLASDDNGWKGTVGVYAQFAKLANKGLDYVNLGFALNDAGVKDIKGNILSLGSSYTNGDFNVLLDFVTNFEADKAGEKDVYLAVKPNYGITDDISVALKFSVVGSYAENSSADIVINPSVAYALGNSAFEAGVNVELETKGATKISFPVSWKYSF